MKTKFNFSTRFAVTALATGALCLAAPLFAQEAQNEQNGQNESSSSSSSASEGSGAQSEMKTDMQDRATTKKTGAMKTTGTQSGTVTSPLTKQDQQFMMMAAKANNKEIAMGKLAEKQGQSAEVKRLGMEMVTDHSRANEELGALAKMHQVKLDTTAPGAANMKGGANFDQQWLSDMVADHQKAIAMFEAEAKNGSESRIMGYATTTLPTLQKHLRDVQKAQGKTSNHTSNSSDVYAGRSRNS